jgi:hypothetical protein
MKTINKTIIGMAVTAALLLQFLPLSAATRQGPGPVKNIVLVMAHSLTVRGGKRFMTSL